MEITCWLQAFVGPFLGHAVPHHCWPHVVSFRQCGVPWATEVAGLPRFFFEVLIGPFFPRNCLEPYSSKEIGTCDFILGRVFAVCLAGLSFAGAMSAKSAQGFAASGLSCVPENILFSSWHWKEAL